MKFKVGDTVTYKSKARIAMSRDFEIGIVVDISDLEIYGEISIKWPNGDIFHRHFAELF